MLFLSTLAFHINVTRVTATPLGLGVFKSMILNFQVWHNNCKDLLEIGLYSLSVVRVGMPLRLVPTPPLPYYRPTPWWQ